MLANFTKSIQIHFKQAKIKTYYGNLFQWAPKFKNIPNKAPEKSWKIPPAKHCVASSAIKVSRQICPMHSIQPTRERSFHKTYGSSPNNLPWSLASMEVKVKDCNCTLRNEHFSSLCPEASHSKSFTPVKYETSWGIWPDPSMTTWNMPWPYLADTMVSAVARRKSRIFGSSCLNRVAVSASASVIRYAGFPDCQNQFNMQHASKICESTRSQSHQKSRLHLQPENLDCIGIIWRVNSLNCYVLIQTGPCGPCRL